MHDDVVCPAANMLHFVGGVRYVFDLMCPLGYGLPLKMTGKERTRAEDAKKEVAYQALVTLLNKGHLGAAVGTGYALRTTTNKKEMLEMFDDSSAIIRLGELCQRKHNQWNPIYACVPVPETKTPMFQCTVQVLGCTTMSGSVCGRTAPSKKKAKAAVAHRWLRSYDKQKALSNGASNTLHEGDGSSVPGPSDHHGMGGQGYGSEVETRSSSCCSGEGEHNVMLKPSGPALVKPMAVTSTAECSTMSLVALNELCQKKNWSTPVFTELQEPTGFRCSVQVERSPVCAPSVDFQIKFQ